MKEKIQALKDQSNPFVLFRLPNEKIISCYFQEDRQTHLTTAFSESGFVFAPFQLERQKIFIPSSYQFSFSTPSFLQKDSVKISLPKEQKERFIHQVSKAKEAIKNGTFEKVVLSNAFTVPFQANSLEVFYRLAKKYPTAFVYYWSHPATGEWLGASPERFLSLESGNLSTVALAGTLIDENADWSAKELHEQELVLASILTTLQLHLPLNKLTIGERKTIPAGKLRHLCTSIEVKVSSVDLCTLVEDLHPTPAVGGLPKQTAMEHILRHEHYDRKYYTGFLGPFSKAIKAHFFVNLRCAEILPKEVQLYTGAGITAGSEPIKEWNEICRKANTFLAVL